MNKKVLIFNSGSSSIKAQLFEIYNNKRICYIIAEKIFIGGNIILKTGMTHEEFNFPLKNHDEACKKILETLIMKKIITDVNEISFTGHRIVYGGNDFFDSVEITDANLLKINSLSKFAPLHNPSAIKVIKSIIKLIPKSKNMCSFDTAFHHTIPKINHIYPIPYQYYKNYNIRKYGAHGISYKYILSKSKEIFNKEKLNLVICHLGGGSSVCAIKNNLSFDTSMGLTPLGGLVMGTRCGDLDPSIIEFIYKDTNSISETFEILNKKSGILALSGLSSDMREVVSCYNQNERAKLSIDVFAKQVSNYITTYVNNINDKIDGIIFTGGIGENSYFVIEKIIKCLYLLNVNVNNESLYSKYDSFKKISNDNSKINIYCVRTNEEKMILTDLQRIFLSRSK